MRDGAHKGLEKHGFSGTPHFGSIHGLTGFTLNRRDDIESLGYAIMFIIDKLAVPWVDSKNIKEIIQNKQEFLRSE